MRCGIIGEGQLHFLDNSIVKVTTQTHKYQIHLLILHISGTLRVSEYFALNSKHNERSNMTVSYKKLWVLCAEKEISQADLRKTAGIASATFTKLRKNQEVNLSILLRIADVLHCDAGDMMEFIPDDQVLREVDIDEVW